MNRLRCIPVLLLALAACAPPAAAPSAPAQPAAATDEAAVYAAVIDHFVPAGKSALVIDSTAVPRGPVAGDVARRASAELAASFTEANRAARALPRPLPTTRTVRLTRRGELPAQSADGHYEFSAIGFDAARSTALLYTSHVCGSLCGSGSLVTLRRTNGRWQVAEAQTLWVS